MRERICLVGTRNHFPEDIRAGAGRVLLIACSHVAGTHRSAAKFSFTAVSRSIALFGGAKDTHRLGEVEYGFELRRFLIAFVAQIRIHWRRFDNLARIKNIIRIPDLLELKNQLVVMFANQLWNKLTPQTTIAEIGRASCRESV